jgi:hypothetical protein
MNQDTTTRIASLNALIAGLQKNKPKGTFTLSGTTYTAAQLVTICNSILTSLGAVPPARAAYRDAVASADAVLAEHHDVLRDLKQLLQLQAGTAMAVLADYGITPRKPTGPVSPKVKVAAAEKAEATRTARHTMGSKQKALITGTVPVPAPAATTFASDVASAAAPSVVTASLVTGH